MWIDDQVLSQCHQPLFQQSWIPEFDTVVMGRSNKAPLEVHEEKCQQDGVPILKRYGGGGTVVLYPGCVVVSVGAWVASPYKNDKYFQSINQALIRCFQQDFPQVDFHQRGYSDIVINDRKFVGTSLFRSRTYLLYQASILVSLELEKIQIYLKHPTKEPAYRAGRDHRDFLTSLSSLDSSYRPEDCLATLNQHLDSALVDELGSELSEPLIPHMPHLLGRTRH